MANGNEVSISSTFYEQLLRQYLCAEKLQSQTASTKSFLCKNIGSKAARKMLVKLTPGGMGSMTCSKGGGMSKMKMLGQCGAAAICTGASSMGGSCSLCQYENKVQQKPLNVITLGQVKSDNINRMIILTEL